MGVNKKKKEGHVPLVIDDGGVVESSTQGMQTSMKSFFKPAVVTKAAVTLYPVPTLHRTKQ